jgi:hypothetical protein
MYVENIPTDDRNSSNSSHHTHPVHDNVIEIRVLETKRWRNIVIGGCGYWGMLTKEQTLTDKSNASRPQEKGVSPSNEERVS